MNRRESIKTMTLGALASRTLLDALGTQGGAASFASEWQRWPDMRWVGPACWGNRLQDWQLRGGRAACRVQGPHRTLHCLTHRLGTRGGDFEAAVDVEVLARPEEEPGYVGFRLGAKGPFEDYRSAAVFGEGLDVGVTTEGRLLVGEELAGDRVALGEVRRLRVQATAAGEAASGGPFDLVLAALGADGAVLAEAARAGVEATALTGTVALVCHMPDGGEGPAARFGRWTMQGGRLAHDPEAAYGPIMFAQYTLHRGTLKLTAQLAPVEQVDGLYAVLETPGADGGWVEQGRSAVDPLARIARFRLEDWNASAAVPYRVRLPMPLEGGTQDFVYAGTVAHEPGPDEPLRLAVFSCNADHGFPDGEVVRHVQKHQPHAAAFLGDQFYEGTGGFGVQRGPVEEATLDMLHKWYMFGWSYRDLYRAIPVALIPDDHDVYHGNIWGEGGADAPVEAEGWGYDAQDAGGYKMPPPWVDAVQRAQTSHLPDPYDATPVKQGLDVYYTDWCYGGVSFAILEDRKFKSAPQNVLPPEAEVTNGFVTNTDFDITAHRGLPEAHLLGTRQHRFLRNWCEDWSGNVQMKAVLSQTNFCAAHTLPAGATGDSMVPGLPLPEPGTYVEGDAPVADMDTNGWPQNRRDEAVRLLRTCRAFHIAGDQHLATMLRYGVDAFDDAGFAFTSPALNNIWPRRWWPDPSIKQKALEDEGAPAYTGSFFDGFGNRMTVHAAANPRQTGRTPARIYDRVTGYGLITFDPAARTVRVECWPRYVDPEAAPDGQYDGWPVTVRQDDGDGRAPVAYLPELQTTGLERPVIQVVAEDTGEIVYTVRLAAATCRPPVFREGTYTVRLGDGDTWRATLDGVRALPPEDAAAHTVDLGAG